MAYMTLDAMHCGLATEECDVAPVHLFIDVDCFCFSVSLGCRVARRTHIHRWVDVLVLMYVLIVFVCTIELYYVGMYVMN